MRSWVVVALAACNGDKGRGEELIFEDANNFAFDGDFTLADAEVEAGVEFCVDWSAVTTDIRGRAFDPFDVDQVAFLQFGGDHAAVEAQIENNWLRQDDADEQWLWSQPEEGDRVSAACNGQFEIIGNFLDPADVREDATQTWVLSLIDLDTGRNDVLSTLFVSPLDASTNHDIAFDDASATLDYTVDIAGKPPIVAHADAGAWTLDWSGVTVDVDGVPFDSLLGDELLIAHYASFTDLGEVEDVFLRLDTEADETYTLNVFGEVSADLSEAETADGGGFGGFTTDGVWLVAVSCTTCTSPVPQLLAAIDVQ